ncbi:arginine--tRNA ligase [Candidatus Poribacteria bacterium]|nr:arginine--tRNA ligase [Candidatus Poribacteria bacterium]
MWQGHNNILANIKAELRNIIIGAIDKAKEDGSLKIENLPDFPVQKPDQPEYGDLSTSLALMLAKEAKMAPRKIAGTIIDCIDDNKLIQKIEIAGPGFINFFLTDDWLHDLLKTIHDKKEKYGESDVAKGQKAQVEFVSANPVGPLNVVSARAASVGDSIANLLKAIGYEVERESYINDAGGQVNTFARSLEARYRQIMGDDVEFPEDGYHGAYIKELAQELIDDFDCELHQKSEEERLGFFREEGLQRMIQGQKDDLSNFRVVFDVWASEKSVRDSGKVNHVIQYLKDNGYTYSWEGAVWFKSTLFCDDRDRPAIKSNGDVTYIVPDWAYHLDKSQRGFDKVIDLWGPDHHGYINRMQAGMQALGLSPEWLEILIVQQVNLLSKGQAVRMSKRAGQFVTLKQLVDELTEKVGHEFAVDVARFFFQMRSTSSHLDFDMDLAIQQAEANPVFYIQYAHARICSIFRQAEEQGIDRCNSNDVNLGLMSTLEERELMKKLSEFPDTIQDSALDREPHRIARYLQDLASTFHSFYNKCRVLDADNMDMTKARMFLVSCVQITLKNGLSLLGISAPTSM